MYIYLDESGDLGFDFRKAKTTHKFVIYDSPAFLDQWIR